MDHAKRREVLVVLCVGAAFILALFLELPGVNGTSYWHWPWRSLDVVNTLAVFTGPLLMIGALAWLWSRTPPPSASDVRALAGGLFVCEVLLQWARLRAEPGGWAWLDELVQSRDVTSYYTDALRIDDVGNFLRDFSWKRLEHHSSTHPPGPVLFYWLLLQLFEPGFAARAGGALIGVLASTGVIVAYWFAGLWTPDPLRRLGACFAYALMPSLLVVLPSFDQIYPIFTMLGLLVWNKAFDKPAAAILLGLIAFVATNVAYQFVLLGVPFGLYALAVLRSRGWDFEVRRAMVRAAVIALGVWLGANIVLSLLTPFHPLDSFVAAIGRQARYAAFLQRPYGLSTLYDPFDFFLGGGILVLPLLVIHFAREDSRETVITFACLLSILIIDLTGLIRCEAARVWLFLQPLAIVPAGLTLSRFRPPARGLVLGLSALILVAIVCKLIFLRVP
ncbi:MAG TPA: hypothetical protein VFG30_28955 [Polyangiales bacterium]|nr:hypothetical protein [Polyangiales bacterium]